MLDVLLDALTELVELSLLIERLSTATLMLGCLTVEGKRPSHVWLAPIPLLEKSILHELAQFELRVWLHLRGLVVVLISLGIVRLRDGPLFGAHTCSAASLQPLVHQTFLVDPAQGEHRFGASVAALFIKAYCLPSVCQRCEPEEVSIRLHAHLLCQLLLCRRLVISEHLLLVLAGLG